MRRLCLSCALFATLVLAGCSSPADPAIAERARQTALELRDGHLTLQLDLQHPFLDDHMRLDVWHARPDRTRLEVLESNQLDLIGLSSASEGSRGWRYRPGQHRLDQGPIEQVKPAIVHDLLGGLLALIFAEEGWSVSGATAGYLAGREAVRLDLNRPDGACRLWVVPRSLTVEEVACTDVHFGRFHATVDDAEYNMGLPPALFDLHFAPAGLNRVDRVP